MKTKTWYGWAAAEDPLYRRQLASFLLSQRRLPPFAQPGAPGHVVEFLKAGRSHCGVLLRKGLREDEILDSEGKEDHVDHDKIVDVSSAFVGTVWQRHEIIEVLRSIDRERDRLKSQIDAYELWEVVEPEGDEWNLDELAALYFPGGPGPHGRAAIFRALEESRAFHRRGWNFVPLKPRQVAAAKEEEQRAAENEAWLQEAADWLRGVAGGKEVPRPVDEHRAIELLAGKVLFGAEAPHADQASTLARLAHFHSCEAIFDVLVKLGHWSKDENLELVRHRIPIVFPDEAIAEAEGAEWDRESRTYPQLWLRRVYSFGGGPGYHERAISIRPGLFGFLIGIHFASPALLIEHGGHVEKTAMDRAAALHLPDRLIPMLPQTILKTAALTESALRPCLSVHVRFGWGFRLRNYRMEICRVRVGRAMTVEEANARIHRDWGLRILYRLARELRQQRTANGAVIVEEPEVEPRVRDGKVMLVRSEPGQPARLIENELTVLANTLAGQFCKEHGVPVIYRTGAECTRVVAPGKYDPVANYRQKLIMPKATHQVEPAPHHGLGVECYTLVNQAGSRCTDLLTHQQIVSFLDDGKGPYNEEDLTQSLLYTWTARTAVHEVESVSRRYWLLRYLEERVGEETEAVVLERSGNRCVVELTETRLRGLCRIGSTGGMTPGRRMRVRIIKASARADVLMILPTHGGS
jgi:exoribonuclease-2